VEGVALSGLLPRDTDETKGNEHSIGDLYAEFRIAMSRTGSKF